MKTKISVVLAILFLAFNLYGQADSCWNVFLVKKNRTPDFTKTIGGEFNPNGFYLYRNCIYEIDLKDNRRLNGRLIDVTKDTLVFTNFFNQNVADKAKTILDTLIIHYGQLHRLNLIADRAYGWYQKYDFDSFDFIFKQETSCCYIESDWYKIFENDTAKYELVPHLTAQGMNLLFEDSGKTYYFYGAGMIKPDRSKMDITYDRKNFVWLIPCRVEEINGLAIGLQAKNIKNREYNERDSLVIRGLSLQINPFDIFMLMNPRLNGPYPDSVDLYFGKLKPDWRVRVKGVHLSLVNTINEMESHGVNITSGLTVIDEIHGVSISGINNFCYILNGVSIAGLRNRAMTAKGVQVGLFNRSAEMRGIQIGLWNTNGKRSLPFVNWQFRAKK